MKRSLIIPLFLFACATSFAQSKLSLQTQFYLSGQEQSHSKEFLKAFNTRTIGEEQYVSAYIHIRQGMDLSQIEALGVNLGIRLPEVLTAQIPVSKLKAVAELEGVKYVQMGTKVQQQLDVARELTLVDKLHGGEGLDQPFMGKDVVVGVIDGGFEYGHPTFYNADKSELRIKRVWNQNLSGTKPEKFSYGCELKTEDEIIKATIDEKKSHGSHVTGIAAGADRLNDNPYYGVAGEADIVLVSLIDLNDLGSDLVQISDGVKYIFDYAESVGKPCVINMSLGTHDGPHDGTSSFDVICDQLQGKGRLISASMGNDGNKDYHVTKTFKSAETAPLKTGISLTSGLGIIDIWGEEGMKFTVQACIVDAGGNTIQITDPMDASDPQGGIQKTNASASSGVSGYFQVGTEVSPLNNKPHASILTTCGLRPNKYIGFVITPLTPGTVHAWCVNSSATFSNLGIGGWSAPSYNTTISEIGTGKRTITVGAYVSKNKYTTISGEEKNTGNKQLDLAPFSSLGPTPDGRMKPTVTAPGSHLASSIPGSQFVSSSDVVRETTWNNTVYRYSMMSGTSMASPMVAGILATWLEAFPELTPELAVEAIKNSAIKDEYTGSLEGGSNKWGYGKIDAYNGIKEVLRLKADVATEKTNLSEVILLPAESGTNTLRLLFTEANANVRIAAYTANGEMVCQQQENLIDTAQEINLNIPTGKGIYIVKVTGDNYSGNYKAIIK